MSAERWGRDPLQRALRGISVLAFLALIASVVLDPVRSADLPLDALLVGAILIQLGYDVAIPTVYGMVARRGKSDGPEPPEG